MLSVDMQANEFDNVEQIIAVGDIHGADSEFHSLLLGIGVINDKDEWRAGGNTHLVSLGDLLDRGPDSRKVMDLLMRLHSPPKETTAAGC